MAFFEERTSSWEKCDADNCTAFQQRSSKCMVAMYRTWRNYLAWERGKLSRPTSARIQQEAGEVSLNQKKISSMLSNISIGNQFHNRSFLIKRFRTSKTIVVTTVQRNIMVMPVEALSCSNSCMMKVETTSLVSGARRLAQTCFLRKMMHVVI